ncbi:MAG TPA: SPOR domain-containing protein [Caulobacteraceae bacterium]|nr:SPOR domain-containing protein [Caulobacteraceae bacterium]
MSTTRRDYEPTERPLAFDGRDAPSRRGPAPIALVVSLLLLIGLGGGVFYLYRGGVRAPSGPPAPVGVPIRDVRVAAPPQPQPPDPAAGLSIYKDQPTTTTTQASPAFVAPPEQPTPRPAPGQEVLVAPTAGPIAAAPADVPQAKPVKTASIDSILATQPAASAKPAVALAKPATAKLATAPTVKTATTDKSDKVSGFVVQIGAFSSQTLANKSWDGAAGVAPGAMAGKGKHIAPMSKDGATLYRVAITGFSNRADAQALCAKLTAAGRTCFVR